MKVTHSPLFYEPFSVYTPDNKITQPEKDFLKNLETSKIKTGGSVSTSVDIFNEHPELQNIRNVMLDVAECYKRDVFGIDNELAPLHSWITVQNKGDYHHPHTHPNVLFNLIYYIEGAENAPLRVDLGAGKSRLTESFNLAFNISNTNGFNCGTYEYNCKDGEIVCIPGYLNHGTEPSKGHRVCLGYNFFVKGVLGDMPICMMNLSTSLYNDK
tara:strand:- start:38 stop:676 length:639 start_codon:yes stop_codon:yes gene_type:complete